MPTLNKLEYLDETKQQIKTALNTNFNSQITDNDTFRSYVSKINNIYTNWPKVTAEGTDLTLSNTKNGLMSLGLEGNTSQFSTNGNQLIDFNSLNATTGSTSSFSNNVLTGSCESGYRYPAIYKTISDLLTNNSGKSLKIGYENLTSSNANASLIMQIEYSVSGGANQYYWIYQNNTTRGFTIPANVTSGRFIINLDNTSSSVENTVTITKPLLYFDNNSTYEPYTNGASPNPSYPQEVKVVTGNNSVKVEGKNLWSSEWEKGYINASGNNEASNNIIRTKDYISVIPNQHYAIKRNITTSYTNVRGYDKNKNFLGAGDSVITWVSGDGGSSTNPIQALKSYCVIYPNDNVYYLRFNDFSDDLSTQYMMIKGDTPTDYEPYKSQTYTLTLGNTELCKINDSQDYVYKSNGNWYKHKEIEKVVYTGASSENWAVNTYNANTYSANKPTNIATGETNMLCNLTKNFKTSIAAITNDGIVIGGSLNYKNVNISDLTQLQTSLGTTNLILYYPLATPTNEAITDTTLINQLNLIEKAMSYSSQTNISQTNDDLPFIISASALMKGGN